MRAEAAPALEKLRLAKSPTALELGFELYEGALASSGRKLFVGLAGEDPRFGVDRIGTLPAALLAYLAIQATRPAVIVSAGTAGAFRARGASIGDVYLGAKRVSFHSRRIPLGAFEPMGRGDYPVADTLGLARRLGLKTGIVSTGDSFDYTPEDLRAIERNGGELKEMEAAAIAWVAELKQLPFIPLKAVTNVIDAPESTPEQFTANLETAVERLTEELLRLLPELDRAFPPTVL